MKKQEKTLSAFERHVIENAGTEAAFSGRYVYASADGIYACKRCKAPLYRSEDKFDSRCGWPSFDDAIAGAVLERPDPDGRRTEIVCSACKGHLGHVFRGEQMTSKNTRHCVNSVSVSFEGDKKASPSQETAILASGCFWGTEYFLARLPGVVATKVGYTGGHLDNPNYAQVCSKTTGHYEAVEVLYDPSKTSYKELVTLFFETHDFTQEDGQGPDIGPQYRSAIFYLNDEQKAVAEALIFELKDKGYTVATAVLEGSKFWPAEEEHQDYYEAKGQSPYCHSYKKIF